MGKSFLGSPLQEKPPLLFCYHERSILAGCRPPRASPHLLFFPGRPLHRWGSEKLEGIFKQRLWQENNSAHAHAEMCKSAAAQPLEAEPGARDDGRGVWAPAVAWLPPASAISALPFSDPPSSPVGLKTPQVPSGSAQPASTPCMDCGHCDGRKTLPLCSLGPGDNHQVRSVDLWLTVRQWRCCLLQDHTEPLMQTVQPPTSLQMPPSCLLEISYASG